MQIVVSELSIEDAVGRARTRFQRADERLSLALAGSASGLPWVALGVLAVFAGAPALTGIVPLPADAALVMGVVMLVLGGARFRDAVKLMLPLFLISAIVLTPLTYLWWRFLGYLG